MIIVIIKRIKTSISMRVGQTNITLCLIGIAVSPNCLCPSFDFCSLCLQNLTIVVTEGAAMHVIILPIVVDKDHPDRTAP